MNTKLPRLLVTGLFFAVLAASEAAAQASSVPPAVTLVQRTEGEALARGYEEAYKLITSKPIFITLAHNGQNRRVLAGIRDLKAAGSVLVITTERGTTVAIPAADVILLTDERPLDAAPAR